MGAPEVHVNDGVMFNAFGHYDMLFHIPVCACSCVFPFVTIEPIHLLPKVTCSSYVTVC